MNILLHPKAPLFTGDSNPRKILNQIIQSFVSGHFNESDREAMRQAGFVSLFFFLRFIAAHNGPFEKLNFDLHDSMCDFSMSTHLPGSKNAAFLGRFCYKSTIFTIGDSAWGALRDPNIADATFSCTSDRSTEFLHTKQRIFDSNELFAWLYPEYVPKANTQPRWNDKEGVLPNRTRFQTNPTFGAYGVCCNTAGIHADRIHVDDPVGDQQLNANRQSSADMYKTANWLKSNLRTLGKGQLTSTMYAGTRYAVDDAHAFLFNSIKERVGYWKELDEGTYNYDPEEGEWRVYYRMVKENGEIIFPEAYTQEMLDKILEEDPWTYWTQIQNHPQMSGLSELVNYNVKECELLFKDGFKIKYYENDNFGNGTEKLINLEDCDTVQALDPASTEKYINAKTSRSAAGVVAHHSTGKIFLVSLNVDYVPPTTVFNWLFANAKRFYGYLRRCLLEAQGAFKILGPLLKEEEARRKKEALKDRTQVLYLSVTPITKTGEKDAVIRNTLQPLLERGDLYAEKSIIDKVKEELNVFPQSNKKDILDMLCLGVNNTRRPLTESEKYLREEAEDAFKSRVVNAAGY